MKAGALWSLTMLLTTMGCKTEGMGPRGPAPRLELSLSGFQSDAHMEHGDLINREYVLPSDDTMTYFASKGIRTFRLPMYWNRMQPKVGGPLAPGKVAQLKAFLDRADKLDVRVIADLHAFGRRDDKVLGSPELPVAALVSFWAQFARAFKGRFAGYDIMNEPHDMPSPATWPEAAQKTVDAIRKVDRGTIVYVEGDDWSNAERWQNSNAELDIQDPARRIIYSAHQYFDHDTSGLYKKSYDEDGATPEIGAQRVQPFVNWLRARRLKGHIGEFGVPYGDPKWLPVLDNFLNATRAGGDVLTGVTYWMAGDWADVYPLTLQPAKNSNWTDRPQLRILTKRR